MTAERQRRCGATLLVAVALAASASVAHAAEPAPAKPDAKRAWLRSAPAPTAKPAPASSGLSWRFGAVGVVVAGLGGAAMIQRRRKKQVARATNSDLEVVSAARVGNKAEVVVLSVGGRKLLLGVTESEVTRLAWLDSELDGAEAEADEPMAMTPARVPRGTTAPSRGVASAPAHTVSAATSIPEPTRRFRDVLLGALSQAKQKPSPEPVVDAALSIAESTTDVVARQGSRVAAPAGAPEMVDIEGQARGLVLRLQKRA
jgi:flagellar biogenesis protein FliO